MSNFDNEWIPSYKISTIFSFKPQSSIHCLEIVHRGRFVIYNLTAALSTSFPIDLSININKRY